MNFVSIGNHNGFVTGFFYPDVFEYANNGPKYEDILSIDDFNCQVR